MKLDLTTFDRVALGQWLGGGAPKGNLEFIRRALGILEKLELSQEEQKLVGYTRVGTSIHWEDAEKTFQIEFNVHEMAILKTATTWEGWPVTEQHLKLLEKLEAVKLDR